LLVRLPVLQSIHCSGSRLSRRRRSRGSRPPLKLLVLLVIDALNRALPPYPVSCCNAMRWYNAVPGGRSKLIRFQRESQATLVVNGERPRLWTPYQCALQCVARRPLTPSFPYLAPRYRKSVRRTCREAYLEKAHRLRSQSPSPTRPFAAGSPLPPSIIFAPSRIHTTCCCSRCPCPCFGGYTFPWTSTMGLHVHQLASGIASKTLGMWRPQPHHVIFWQFGHILFMHILVMMRVVVREVLQKSMRKAWILKSGRLGTGYGNRVVACQSTVGRWLLASPFLVSFTVLVSVRLV